MRPVRALPYVVAVWCAGAALAQPVSFRVTLAEGAREQPYAGRVYVALSTPGGAKPRDAMHEWFNPPPVFALDVPRLAPGESVTLADGCLGDPVRIEDLAPGSYTAQAVLRINPDSPKPGHGPGDLVSGIVEFEVVSGEQRTLNLLIEHTVPETPFQETDRVKLFEARSACLSAFYGRDVMNRAGVILPEQFDEQPDREWPVVYWIGGFGGSHRDALFMAGMFSRLPGASDILWIVPDATCYWGHSVFADSATNGPRGRALIEEIIPGVEERFRGARSPQHRYVAGISSGGWASLWLQVTYPDTFAGVWSHCPDPIDFHDFQQIDLYDPTSNMFLDAGGSERPLARQGDRVILNYAQFVAREVVLGPGGQIRSFEGVFSPLAPDATPAQVFDRQTGAVDVTVTEAWKRYDIAHTLRSNWKALEPRLAGKLHIIAGGLDSFYLEGPVESLKQWADEHAIPAEIQIVPGMGHTVHMPSMTKMVETIGERWKSK